MPRKKKARLSDAPAGCEIAASRMAAGLTQAQLARRFSVPVSLVRHWESNRSYLGYAPKDVILRKRVEKMMELYPPLIVEVEDITSIGGKQWLIIQNWKSK